MRVEAAVEGGETVPKPCETVPDALHRRHRPTDTPDEADRVGSGAGFGSLRCARSTVSMGLGSPPRDLGNGVEMPILSDNPTDLIWQDCGGVEEPAGIADVPVVDYCPTYNHQVASLAFSIYLEDPVPLGWEGAARSATTLAPFPSKDIRPSLPLIEPLPMTSVSSNEPLSALPIRRLEPLPLSEPLPVFPVRRSTNEQEQQ